MIGMTSCEAEKLTPAFDLSATHYTEKADTVQKKAILVIETEYGKFEQIEIDTVLYSLYHVGQQVTIKEDYFIDTHSSYYDVLPNWGEYESGMNDDSLVSDYTRGYIRKKLWI